MFGLYASLGLGAFLLYRPLSPAVEVANRTPEAPLGPSKKLVYGMAALFGMDSFGTGFLVQSLLALWLYQAFQVSVTTTATILFWTGVCSAFPVLSPYRLPSASASSTRWCSRICRPTFC